MIRNYINPIMFSGSCMGESRRPLISLTFLLSILAMLENARANTMAEIPAMLSYDIRIGGVLAGSFDIILHSGEGGYRIETKARTHGIMDFLIEFRGQNEVHGKLSGSTIRPIQYWGTGTWAGKTRDVAIEYSRPEGIRFDVKPSAEEDEREVVPKNLIVGTVDPLTALFRAMLQTSQSESCDVRAKIFDGRRRYDVISKSLPEGITKGPVYSGPARHCRIRRNLIAGKSRRSWMPQFARPDWVDLWITPLRSGTRAMPVRVHADLGIASLVVDLVAIGGRNFPPGENDAGTMPAEADEVHDVSR